MVALAKSFEAVTGTMELVNAEGGVIIQANKALEKLHSVVDISDLSLDQTARLFSSIDHFTGAHHRLNEELFQMSLHLTNMRDILGDKRFNKFATEVLGFNQKRVARLLKIYRILEKHFTEADGKFHPNRIEKFSESALLMLADDTDSEVVALLEDMAHTGKVTAGDVKRLLEQRAAEQDASIKALTAEVAQAERAAQEARDRADLEISRLRVSSESKDEQLRRVLEQRDAMEEENRQLQEQASAVSAPKPQIVEKIVEKPVVPAEYASKEEAMAGIEAKLRDKANELQRINSQVESLKTEATQLQQNVAVQQASVEELSRLRGKVEEVQMMFPAALLAKIKSTDQNIAAELAAIGELLILTGTQLKGA